jgi:acyl-coenzyme A synthetase/AMP-(fatty) acid ligase
MSDFRMVKRRAYRLELAEVERCLDRHPGVAEASVIALPDAQSDVQILRTSQRRCRAPLEWT